jgi:hypothetical protein
MLLLSSHCPLLTTKQVLPNIQGSLLNASVLLQDLIVGGVTWEKVWSQMSVGINVEPVIIIEGLPKHIVQEPEEGIPGILTARTRSLRTEEMAIVDLCPHGCQVDLVIVLHLTMLIWVIM